MDKDDFALMMIRSVATRQKLPDDLLDRMGEGGVEMLLAGRPRIGAVLDRAILCMDGAAESDHAPYLVVGPYRFFPAESFLQQDEGDDIRLTEKERDILLELLGAKGGVVLRKTMLDKVWGYVSGVETHTLETHIYRLRQKIEADPARPVLLRTEEDGYSLS